MIAVLIIILLIAGISLYDYTSSRYWQQVTSDERNDVVFENRNHLYGAYRIRRDYSKSLILVVCSVTLAIGSAFGIYKIIQGLPKPAEIEVPVDTTTFAVDAEKPEEPLEPIEPEIPPMEKTIQFLEPEVTDDKVETPPPLVDPDIKASTETNEKEEDPFAKVEPVIKKEEPVKKQEVEILEFVEENAEFPGGAAALKKYLADNIKYPQTAIEMDYQGKCYVKFVVSDEGYISNVRVTKGVPDCPECDKEAVRVIKAMPRWKPGRNNGKEVNMYFNSTVVFKLQ